MYSRIMVAVDGSATADLALTEAVQLAKTQDATLRIVHVIDATDTRTYSDLVSVSEINNAKLNAARGILSEAAAFAKKAGLQVETRLLEIERLDQRIVEVLAEEANAWPADLVVTGTNGQRGLNRLLGSVAEEFARTAAQPVLLVRDVSPEQQSQPR